MQGKYQALKNFVIKPIVYTGLAATVLLSGCGHAVGNGLDAIADSKYVQAYKLTQHDMEAIHDLAKISLREPGENEELTRILGSRYASKCAEQVLGRVAIPAITYVMFPYEYWMKLKTINNLEKAEKRNS